MVVFQVLLRISSTEIDGSWFVVSIELQNLQTDYTHISRIGRHEQQQSTIKKRITLQGRGGNDNITRYRYAVVENIK